MPLPTTHVFHHPFQPHPRGHRTLKQGGLIHREHPTHITVNGYSDNTGDDAVNVSLSDNRANSVADFLIAKGVTGDRITAKGMGAANPVAGNDTPEGRARNRRVEIVVS
ncbi:hypothetical protein MHEC_09860 [Mycobacterium heckeshornense]|uniref:OmpA-like domain-containing protein n=2 Tax=Mycobacterium heckeshornense TaxID=110505 RepID=A0A7R7GR79_9MYCO|nr:OmpA family protein [Mycobacterium heckeshornense]BCO34553.1 hypothetical protein MHEC_09860 [Mycobacterium heckeshornense]